MHGHVDRYGSDIIYPISDSQRGFSAAYPRATVSSNSPVTG